MRIVSLLASGTEIVCALGLADQLVAISHECDYPATILDRPRVSRPRFDPMGLSSGAIDSELRRVMAEHGSAYAVDEDQLRAVRPDLILTQDVCEVCAVPTTLAEQAVRAIGRPVEILSLDAHDIHGILHSVRRVADAAGAGEAGIDVVSGLRRRLEMVATRVAPASRPRVMVLEWLDPPFIPGHWGPEMVDLAGGENVAGQAGKRSKQATWDQLKGLDPDVLLVAPCGYGLPEAKADADRFAAQLASVAPRAIAEGRAWVADGSAYFNRSGPRVADGVEILGAIVHPDRFPDVDLSGRAAHWTPATSPAGGAARYI
ncbi:MAG TPA: ABC transporter substrate-binding protein [Gemmatimonadales bacterium]|jgi:iron complex transport system substrate-binding protein